MEQAQTLAAPAAVRTSRPERPSRTGGEREEDHEEKRQHGSAMLAGTSGTGKRKRSVDDTGRSGQYRLPVLETDQLRVIEPDGTEDPWANADDGVVPEQPSTSPDTKVPGSPGPRGRDKGS